MTRGEILKGKTMEIKAGDRVKVWGFGSTWDKGEPSHPWFSGSEGIVTATDGHVVQFEKDGISYNVHVCQVEKVEKPKEGCHACDYWRQYRKEEKKCLDCGKAFDEPERQPTPGEWRCGVCKKAGPSPVHEVYRAGEGWTLNTRSGQPRPPLKAGDKAKLYRTFDISINEIHEGKPKTWGLDSYECHDSFEHIERRRKG